MNDDQTGTTNTPVTPCEECAALTKQQLGAAIGAGVLLGAVSFYLFRRYAG